MPRNAVAIVPSAEVTDDELRVLKETLNPDLTNPELRLFALVAKRSGLDPFAKQIFAVKRAGRVTFQTSQEGYLSIAERTGEYDGCDEPEYGRLKAGHPEWATVRVYRKGMTRGVAATAHWDEYYPGDGQGSMWRKMPRVMLAKVARVAALRLAFPYVYADLYSDDEMGQADRPTSQRTDVDRETGEITAPRQISAPRPVSAPPSVPQADVEALHAQFREDPDDIAAEAFAAATAPFTPDELDGIAPSGWLSASELFAAAERAGITKAQLTIAAKTMFGANRWKVTDLTDDERHDLWEDFTVPA